MKTKDSQNSTSELKMFQIPIEKYEKNVEINEKKKEILDLFKNSNYLQSEEEFKEIEYRLQVACEKGDLELIKIYLSKRIENATKDMIFNINKTNQTASLFKIERGNDNIIILHILLFLE